MKKKSSARAKPSRAKSAKSKSKKAPSKLIPAGYHAVMPYLIVSGAAKAIEFYKDILGAKEKMRMAGPNDKIGHAELVIGDSLVMLADEFPEMGARAPQPSASPDGCASYSLYVYVKDVDDVVARATAAGAKVVRPVQDQFYGDRTGSIVDPFGHTWGLATRKETLTPAELKKRAAAMGMG